MHIYKAMLHSVRYIVAFCVILYFDAYSYFSKQEFKFEKI
jgi:hypothetical protein